MKNKPNVIPKKKYSRILTPNKISIKLSIRLREGLNEMAAEKGILVSELVTLQNYIVQNIPDEDHRYYFL